MKDGEILNCFVSKCLRHSAGFALWFLPGKSNIYAIVQETGPFRFVDNFNQINDLQGFLMAPFVNNVNHKSILLSPDKYFVGLDQLKKYGDGCSNNPELIHDDHHNKLISTKHADYLDCCNAIIERIKSNEAQKVVYSRIEVLNKTEQPHLADLLLKLKLNYPNAFSYLFYTPQTGLWMGASPEIFLRESENTLQTIALAGTRPKSSSVNGNHPWPGKERVEQKFVSDYIKKKLENIGIEKFRISEPYTLNAGSIEHIRSDFFIDKKPNRKILGKIVQSLHPTPAVCGQSLAEALEIILQTENHSREYYTGFLGALNLEGKSDLFVNLRCMKIIDKQIILFIGGGITADSEAEAEWEETVLKAGILKKAIEQV